MSPLSRRRAEAVAAELTKNFRIAPTRLRTAGVGFLAPIGSNANEPGRALNRRVELWVVPDFAPAEPEAQPDAPAP